MKEELFAMSTRDIEILSVVQNIVKKKTSQIAAAKQLGITTRHIRRLVSAYTKYGVKGLISKQRGKISNRRFSDGFKLQVQEIICQNYIDFGPTLAVEKLQDLHNISLAIETARQWMIEAEIWKPKHVKVKVIHPRRPRRSHFGELIQIDGSPHAWFEDRGTECCLLVFIDDSTSKIMMLHFCKTETTFSYIDTLRKYIERYGKPQSIYSDKHAIFKINTQDAIKGINLTQFGRVLKDLDIEHIHANSPQAKGRVERCNETLQGSLVKEFRLLNINTIEAANAFVDKFIYIDEHNLRFSVPPAKEENGHLPMPSIEILDKACCVQHTRIVSGSLNCQYNNHIFQIKAPGTSYNLCRAKVIICQNSTGDLKMFLTATNQSLEFQVYTKNSQLCKEEAMLPEKLLPARMDKKHKPAVNHPWRQYKLKTS